MLIKWFGHASFKITTGQTSIITDPFNEKLGYPMFTREADVVTISHPHWDHVAAECISGQPQIITENGPYHVNDIFIEGFSTFHDKNQGRERGTNTIYKIGAEGINLLHLGDLGHALSQDLIDKVGQVDILMLPVGGKFTVDADEAYEIVGSIKPQIVIPMHFQTPHLSFALAGVEEFLSKFERVIKLPCLDIAKPDLQGETKIIVLEYLLG